MASKLIVKQQIPHIFKQIPRKHATMASKSFHNSHGNSYERMASNTTLSIAKIFLAEISPSITSSSYILDNACGPGIVTQLIKTQHPSADIMCADLAPGMIDVLKGKIEEKGWEGVETEVLDVRDLKTLGESTFSHVLTNFGFAPNVEDPEGPARAAREMFRVLKKGGVAVVTTWSKRNFDSALEAAARIIRPHEEPFSWNPPEDWNKGWWLMKQLEEAGFGNKVQVKSVVGRMEAASLEEMVGNMMLIKDMFYKGYSEEELARLEKVLREEVRKSEAFEQTESDVGMEIVAWVGCAWK